MSSFTEINEQILKFRNDRNWKIFHTPKNLALSIIIELGELFEHLQWKTDSQIVESIEQKHSLIEEEISDVAIYLFLLAHELNVNLLESIPKKLAKNELKYPK